MTNHLSGDGLKTPQYLQKVSDLRCLIAIVLLFFTTYFTCFIINKSALPTLVTASLLAIIIWEQNRGMPASPMVKKPAMLFLGYFATIGIYSLFAAREFCDYRYVCCCYFTAAVAICGLWWAKSIYGIRSMWKMYFIAQIPLACGIFSQNAIDNAISGIKDFPHALHHGFVLLFILPFLSRKLRFILIAVILAAFFYDNRIRINILITSEAIALALLALCHLPKTFYKVMLVTIFIAPFVFLFLAMSEIFNINHISEESQLEIVYENEDVEYNFLGDSRSILWDDAQQVLLTDGNLALGLTPARSYATLLMDPKDQSYGSDSGRRDSEVGFLTFLYWGGIPLTLLWTALYWIASWTAVTKSKNQFCRSLGLYVALQWANSFIELPPMFSVNCFQLFFFVGSCLNLDFIALDDQQMKDFWKGLFSFPKSISVTKKTA